MDTTSLSKIRDDFVPYPHQSDAVKILAPMQSWLNADEPGMGKSAIALLVLAIDFERGHASRAIVVCPATLKQNWAAEIHKQTNFTYTVLHGTPTKRIEQLDEFDSDILITNYEQLKPHLGQLMDGDWHALILDEAHYIKSFKSARTKLTMKLCEFIPRRMLLTGTPVMNQVNELWPILHVVDPEQWPRHSYWSFLNRYAVYGGWKNKLIVGVKNEVELSDKLKAIMVRRLKKEVLDLPEKNVVKIYTEMPASQATLYRQIRDELKLHIPNNPTPMEIESSLVASGKLRMVATTPYALKDGDFPDKSDKLDAVVEKAMETIANGDRPLIFCEYRRVIEALENRFAKLKVQSWSLHGGVPQENRVALVDEWGTAAPGPLIAMISVAGVGLNMAEYSSTVLFANKSWNPGNNSQAIDRVHRVGADMSKPVTIYDFIVLDTVDEKVEKALDLKTTTSESIVGDRKKLSAALFTALQEEINQ